jgi:hypothetical protein
MGLPDSSGISLQDMRKTLHALSEYLEDGQEPTEPLGSPEQRRAEIVQRLLLCKSVAAADIAALDYEIHSWWHLGLVATGAGAGAYIQRLKAHFGRKLLTLAVPDTIAAWLCAQTKSVEVEIDALARMRDTNTAVAIGEPGRDLAGWRLTHEQAKAALPIAVRRPDRIALHAEERLLAGILHNATLVESLRRAYLIPLRRQRDGGVALRQTLRTYIDLECNATSAGHALDVGRRTIRRRVCAAERLFGCSLSECLGELDVALRLAELERSGESTKARQLPDA